MRKVRSTYKPHVTDEELGGYPTEPFGDIPAFNNRKEEAEFWDTHDAITHQRLQPEDFPVEVDIYDEYRERLERIARERNTDAATLARRWIEERLDRETSAAD